MLDSALSQTTPGQAAAPCAFRQTHTECAAWREVLCRRGWQDSGVEVLSSRILLRPADLSRSRRFYRELLGLAVFREFGSATDPSMVFFLGSGLLELSGPAAGPAGDSVMIWVQVRDVHAEHERLAAAGVRILREPEVEPWGLTEMWIEDPDGVRIVLVEVPDDHPLRRDPRSLPAS
jgi:catechol 2,3-dioxygenase-like lactoylglutathione lyase family enzyme